MTWPSGSIWIKPEKVEPLDSGHDRWVPLGDSPDPCATAQVLTNSNQGNSYAVLQFYLDVSCKDAIYPC